MAEILNTAQNIIKSATSNRNGRLVTVNIGGETRRLYMIEVAGGPQILRTQVDIAADGSVYFLVAGKGVGTYECTFLEGPFEACDGSRTMTDYSIMNSVDIMGKNMKDRKIKITTDTGRATVSGHRTTRGKSIFEGVIRNIIQTTQGHENGGVIVVSRINAVGQWKNSGSSY